MSEEAALPPVKAAARRFYFDCAAPNWSVEFFIQTPLYLGYR